MLNLEFIPLIKATWQTIYMTFVSGAISIFLGLALGSVLFLTGRQQALCNKPINKAIGFIVNAIRSLPFIILLISIIPFTQLLIGTTIGTNAAIVPLTIAAIPFFARICSNAFSEVPAGILSTANALGASTWQLVIKFLIPESLPALIKGATLTIIGLIGYSAMAGAVGGGGLGELAINYGYERFNVIVMLETIVVLIIIVQLIQYLGDHLAQRRKLKLLGIVSVILALICIGTQVWPTVAKPQEILKVGVMAGTAAKIMKVAQQEALKRYGLHIKIVAFDDYVQPNVALNNGSINANIFQHVPFLDSQIKAHGFKLSPIAKTFVYPFGFYSRKIRHISQLKPGARIAIPNDPSNEGRALLLLARHHVIGLKRGVGLFPTPHDIVSNPLHLRFIALDAAQIPRALNNVAMGGLTNDYTKPAGFTPAQAVLLEGLHSPYANVIVVRTKDQHDPIFKQLIAVIHSKAFVRATLKAYPDGEAVPAFKR